MKKKPDCTHQLDDETRCQLAFLNQYKCDRCGAVSQDSGPAAATTSAQAAIST